MNETKEALQAIAIANVALGGGQKRDLPPTLNGQIYNKKPRGHYRNNSKQQQTHNNKVAAARHKKNKAAKKARKKTRK